MKRLVIIINQGAGKGRALDRMHDATRTLWGWPCEFRFPRSPGETMLFCENLDPLTDEAVILVGGDGTLNTALPVLIRKKVPLAVFPAGTANDLAAELGLKADWNLIQSLIDRRRVAWIDAIFANGKPFTTIGGMGVGSALTREINLWRSESSVFNFLFKRMKSQMYSLMASRAILINDTYMHRLRITAPHFAFSGRVSSLLICNQPVLGGDLLAAPGARNDDGQFHVALVTATNRQKLLGDVLQAKLKDPLPASHRFVTDRLLIEDLDERAIRIFGDGETLLEAKRVEFVCHPQCLPIYRNDRKIVGGH